MAQSAAGGGVVDHWLMVLMIGVNECSQERREITAAEYYSLIRINFESRFCYLLFAILPFFSK